MQQAIDMITVHDEDGSIRPYRFKTKGEEGEDIAVQVRRIVDKKEESMGSVRSITFYCLCSLNGLNRTFEIKFRKDLCKWFLMRMI